MANGQPGTGQGGSAGTVPLNSLESEFLAAGYGGVFPQVAQETPDLVWMGGDYTDPSLVAEGTYFGSTVGQTIKVASGWMTRDQALGEYWNLDPAVKGRLDNAVAMIDGRVPTESRSLSAYREFLTYATEYNRVNPDNPKSIFELMELTGARNAQIRKLQGGGGGGVSRVVNLTNPDDAKMVVNAALQQYLGRDATDSEIKEFTKALNKAERGAPIVTTRTQRSGGVSPQQRAIEFAQARPEAAETAVATKYMDWFIDKVAADPTKGIASGL